MLIASIKHTRSAVLTISIRPVMCMSRKHMACRAMPMGVATMANQNTLLVTLVDLARQFEVH